MKTGFNQYFTNQTPTHIPIIQCYQTLGNGFARPYKYITPIQMSQPVGRIYLKLEVGWLPWKIAHCPTAADIRRLGAEDSRQSVPEGQQLMYM
jgi:hypothetical protein